MTETGKIHQAQAEVLAQFNLQGTVGRVEPFGSGHIHDTFYVETLENNSPDYLLQRINHHVFKDVAAVMKNIELVTRHLRQRLVSIRGGRPDLEVLTLIPTHQQKSFYKDGEESSWRLFLFLKGTRGYDQVQTEQQAYEGGRAYGKFQALLTDLPVHHLQETIADFHNIQSRYRLFQAALEKDPKGRAKDVVAEIQFARGREAQMSQILKLGQEGKLPIRITHNDTKFNNVLLDADDRAQCVIDLDTVMPGYVAYDFGDAIRTIVNTASEDEKDLDKIHVNLGLFENFTRGYLEETTSFLTQGELDSLVLGVTLLPFLMGLRFLTDYLDGDNYYKTEFESHNLQRARAQFRLVELLEEKQQYLHNTIQKIATSSLGACPRI
ncbi:phosphotransferase enzyme family protein [Rufibacter immobilis]